MIFIMNFRIRLKNGVNYYGKNQTIKSQKMEKNYFNKK